MNIVYKKYKKYKKDLDTKDVLINDTSLLSPDFFNIQEFPDVFTGGKNLIQILGKKNKLVPNTQVQIEILDVNNDPVYYEIPSVKGENNSRYIVPFIFNDTPIGIGKIIIIGVAKTNDPKWKNKPNVKWTRDIIINRDLLNNTKILFNNTPIISINRDNSVYQSISQPDDVVLTDGLISYEYNYSTSDPILFLSGAEFTSDMINASLSVPIPDIDTSIESEGVLPYNTTIYEVLSSTTAIANTRYSNSDSPFSLAIPQFKPSNYNITYTPPIVRTQSETISEKSYLKLNISNLNVLSGDIFRSRLYFRDVNRNSNYELLDDFVYENNSLLSDYSNINNIVDYGKFTSSSILSYWNAYYLNNTYSNLDITYSLNSNYLFEGIKIESINKDKNEFVIFKQNNSILFNNDLTYLLTFDLYTNEYQDNLISIYTSGSAFPAESSLGYLQLIENLHSNFKTIRCTISPILTGIGALVFKLRSDANWYMSNIRLESKPDEKHSLQSYVKYIATPIDHLSSSLEFKLEYFNYENTQAISSSYISLGDDVLYIQPTLDLELDVQNESGTTFEIGSIVDIELTSSFIKNDAGDVLSRNIKNDTTSTVLTTTLTQDIVTYLDTNVEIIDTIRYSTTVNYDEGAIKNNSIGEPVSLGHIPSGSLTDYSYVYGKYRVFAGVSSSYQDANINNAWIRNPSNYQQNPLIGSSALTFKIAVSDEDIFTWIVTPLDRPITSIKLVQSSNAEIIGSFDSTIITIKDASGINNVDYNLYYEKLDIPNSYNVTYSVLIP